MRHVTTSSGSERCMAAGADGTGWTGRSVLRFNFHRRQRLTASARQLPAMAGLEHELNEIGSAPRERALQMLRELLQVLRARALYPQAAREGDPVEIRPVQREHIP